MGKWRWRGKGMGDGEGFSLCERLSGGENLRMNDEW
jgi:hypothetical protein